MPETRSVNQSPAPVARSPIPPAVGATLVVGGWEQSDGVAQAPVLVSDRSALAKVLVRGPDAVLAGALGTSFGRVARGQDRLVVGSGPDEWLVLGRPGTGGELVDELNVLAHSITDNRVTVLDLTHGRALVRLKGCSARDLLRRLTALDLNDRFVPDGAALRTSVARVVTDILRDDLNDAPSYLLHCERSSGRYLQESLLEAGASLGVAVGAPAPGWPERT